MEAEKVQQTPPDPNSITQRKGAFIKTAHQYGQLYEWRKAQDGRFTEKRFRLSTRDILRAAQRLPEQPQKENNRGESRRQNDKPQLPIAHLLGAGYGYRRNPSKETTERLLTMAVNWYQASEDDKKTAERARHIVEPSQTGNLRDEAMSRVSNPPH